MENNSTADAFGALPIASVKDPITTLYEKTLSAGRFHKVISLITRRSNRLLALDSYPSENRNGRYAGQWEVALDNICGTEGYRNDFDNRFRTLTDRTRQRWISIARANDRGTNLPPVELIQVGDVYFVRDGHHRISVARAFGQTTIDARVTVW